MTIKEFELLPMNPKGTVLPTGADYQEIKDAYLKGLKDANFYVERPPIILYQIHESSKGEITVQARWKNSQWEVPKGVK